MGEWKEHKYIAIENGRYIYPEDQKNRDKKARERSEARIAAIDKRDSGNKNSNDEVKQNNTPKIYNYVIDRSSPEKEASNTVIKRRFKGSVDSYEYLPKNPEVGDTYYLENDAIRVCWDGKGWMKVDKEPITKTAPTNNQNYASVTSKAPAQKRESTAANNSGKSKSYEPDLSANSSEIKGSSAYEAGYRWMSNILTKVTSAFSNSGR